MKVQVYSYKYKTLKTLFLAVIFFYALFVNGVELAFAETSLYRSAGWVDTEGDPPFTNLDKCQAADDQYCARSGSRGAVLYFGSFPDLESFGIPLNSTINKISIRIKGKTGASFAVGIEDRYNQKPARSSCQRPSDLIKSYIGPVDKTIEFNFPLTSNNGLVNCITLNNINFRNLTFRFGPYLSSSFSADIDNFEIAFDYTPPAVTPAPVGFPEGQKGTVWEIGQDKSNLALRQELDNVISVATGSNFSVALKIDGTVWTWTNSDDTPKQVKGENGNGFLTDVKKITAGNNFGMALKEDKTVWEWVQGSTEPQNSAIVKYHPGAIVTDVIDIAAGRSHKLVLKSDGKVYGWGLNNDGQVGIGCFLYNCSSVSGPTQTKNLDNVKAISAGWGHSIALKNDGTVWGWGESAGFALGQRIQQNGSTGFSERPLPVQITELSGIKSISSNGFYNLAINSGNEVIEWGNYTVGIPRRVEEMSNASYVYAGPSGYSYGVLGHVIKENGTLWQLYINDIPPKQVPHLKDVVAVASGDGTPSLAVINSSGDVLGDSTVAPFLDLPWEYENGNFDKQVYSPESWFDHKYPLQNIICCTQKVLNYTGEEKELPYRSHAGYDYASRNGVEYRTPVLASATGSAEFKPASKTGGLGNTIKIDHGNGYQTWYGHLDPLGLITNVEGVKVPVAKGQKIGETGYTGSIYPPNKFGAHIHFGVLKDANNNGSFNDDYPQGLVDPLGWDGKDNDPWTEYKVGNSSGSASIKLFTKLSQPTKQPLSKSGGELKVKNVTAKFDPDTLPLDFTVHYKDGPFEYFESNDRKYQSIAPSFFLEVFNSIGDKISQFFKPVAITYDYSNADLSNTKEGTLRLHYYDIQEQEWIPVDSVPDLDKKIIIAELAHFTQFAVMGEVEDGDAPVTKALLSGDKGSDNWYRSDVKLELKADDGEDGVGVDETLYSVDGQTWLDYSELEVLESEGEYDVSFQSADKVGNIENIKKVKFQIDKTPPSSTAQVTGAEGESGWYVSDVIIKLTAEDSASGVAKIEYSLDGGDTYQNYETEIVISKEGVSEVLYRSVDKAGNVEGAQKLSLKIDKTAPSTIVYIGGSHGEDNWYRSNVEIGLNGSDDTSGYKTSYYSLDNGESYKEVDDPIILNIEGTHKIYYYSVDKAGNKEEHKSIEIMIDKTSPVVLITANPATLWPANGKMVNVKIGGKVDEKNLFKTLFNITDEYNLIEPVLAGFDQTIKLEAKRNGNDRDGRMYSVVANAEDLAGNQGSAQVQIIVPHDQR